MTFQDRRDAGRQLAAVLSPHYRQKPGVVIIGLPRGGVVTADEVANLLVAPLDIVAPRKISAPFDEELAIGAVTEDGEVLLDKEAIAKFNIPYPYLQKKIQEEVDEAKRRLEIYRGSRTPTTLRDKTVIVIDDGVATGASMRAAIASIRTKQPNTIIVAVPVIAPEVIQMLRKDVADIVYLRAPSDFAAISAFYKSFEETPDQEVIEIMKKY